jgi:hypothetical protein
MGTGWRAVINRNSVHLWRKWDAYENKEDVWVYYMIHKYNVVYIRAAHHDLLTHMFPFVVTLCPLLVGSKPATSWLRLMCVRACMCVWVCACVRVCVRVWILKFNAWRGFPVDYTSRWYVSILVPKIKFLSCPKCIIFSRISRVMSRRMY